MDIRFTITVLHIKMDKLQLQQRGARQQNCCIGYFLPPKQPNINKRVCELEQTGQESGVLRFRGREMKATGIPKHINIYILNYSFCFRQEYVQTMILFFAAEAINFYAWNIVAIYQNFDILGFKCVEGFFAPQIKIKPLL